MRARILLFLLSGSAGLVLPSCGPSAAPAETARLILYNGRVITVDSSDRVAEAVAIGGGRILAVGSEAEVRAFSGPDTESIDLQGRGVTPGLLDAHSHFLSGGVDRLYEMDLSYPNVKSVGDVVEMVRRQVDVVGPGEWIQGRGWDEGKLEENRYLYAEDLDRVAPDNPVWLTHTMGHYGVANRRALELAGIGRETPDPPGGTIDRDRSGAMTGVLKESAQSLVRSLIPELSAEQREKGLRSIIQEFNKEGMTGLKDPGIGFPHWETYQQVKASGDLSVRVFALWRPGRTLEDAAGLLDQIGSFSKARISTGDNHLISGGIKLAADGSGGARTAWLHEDWNRNSSEQDTGNSGYPARDPEVLRQQIFLFHRAGLHVSVHAIGDRAIDWVVDSYAEALRETPISGLRHGIIHANIPTDHAIETMARLQREYQAGYPEPSATFMWWIGDTYAGNFGPQRALRLNPFQTFLQKGMIWADGSDFNVTPFPARYGLWASIARETLLGVYGKTPWGLEESVDIRTALRSRTIWAAHQMFLESQIGSIEVGKYADLAVWDRDPYSIQTEAIRDMKCLMTIFNGEIVYRAAEGL